MPGRPARERRPREHGRSGRRHEQAGPRRADLERPRIHRAHVARTAGSREWRHQWLSAAVSSAPQPGHAGTPRHPRSWREPSRHPGAGLCRVLRAGPCPGRKIRIHVMNEYFACRENGTGYGAGGVVGVVFGPAGTVDAPATRSARLGRTGGPVSRSSMRARHEGGGLVDPCDDVTSGPARTALRPRSTV